ncbi:VRR-NUC domain protein [Ancylostoma ceylanicum]|uniref:Fanconi-associated nuclease n=1 Tax=Ancylostoma ceylanicum TaxID=53326 RepID=A0A0D6MCC1_9BILA|nr:VRR-NUC domain protein [Ancylostoma ceylanicum]
MASLSHERRARAEKQTGKDNRLIKDESEANPIDLNSRDLYVNRQERFDERFTWLETAADDELEDVVRSTWSAQNLQETSEINWELFQSVDDFLEFLFCCPRPGLLAVLRRVITDYRNCRSGFPDLTMWNTKTKKVAVVEVKGPGDRLSTKQRLWLDYFMRHEIRAEVCHVIAKGSMR